MAGRSRPRPFAICQGIAPGWGKLDELMVATALPSERFIQAIGRYVLHDELASGGMASVHFGRLVGAGGFARTVAIKRVHRHLSKDKDLVAMVLDEARVAARIRHPNVVATLDVVPSQDELLLVMEYIHGESVSGLSRSAGRFPLPIAAAVLIDVLNGLHAAHEARDEAGEPLHVVHRDVSPQNILVGADGVARVLDFGIAKARGRIQTTETGQLKGKLAYIAPEQFARRPLTRQVDVYAAAIVFWQALTGERLFEGDHDAAIVEQILYGTPRSARSLVPDLPEAIEAILVRGLAREPADRFADAKEMALAIERTTVVASVSEVSRWVETQAREALAHRARVVARIEASQPALPAPSPRPDTDAPTQTDVVHHERSAETKTETGSMGALAPPVSEPRVPPRPRRGLAIVIGASALAAVGIAIVAIAARRAPPFVAEAGASIAETRVPVPSAEVSAGEPTLRPPSSSAVSATAPPSAPSTTARPRPVLRPRPPPLPRGLPGERN